MYEPEFDDDRADAVARAVGAGVDRMLLPAIDSESHGRMMELCRTYPRNFFPMMGLHPTSVNDNPRWREELDLVERIVSQSISTGHDEKMAAEKPTFYGIGEIGLDFYWSSDFRDEQIEALRRQFDLALHYNLPVAIHTREAWEEMTQIIESYAGKGLRGVFHAFSEDVETYRRLAACGDFLFGIGGTSTYKKSNAPQLLPAMELDHIVLETDCPYLTPVPYRGKRNESSYVPIICRRVAELKGLEPGEVARRTTANAERMFGLPLDE